MARMPGPRRARLHSHVSRTSPPLSVNPSSTLTDTNLRRSVDGYRIREFNAPQTVAKT